MFRFFYLISLFTVCFGSLSFLPVNASNYGATSILPSTSRASLIVEPLGNPHRTVDVRSHTFYPPASTMKLLTALAAKLELGDQFRFKTTLAIAGKDVVIKFSGDPQLSTKNLKHLFLALKKQGIHQIKGNLWLDNSLFTGYERAIGWPWDILGVCYSAPSSVITLDHNCVPGSIYTKHNGKTRVHIPEQYLIHVSTQAIVVSQPEQKQQLCELELHSDQENHYQLSGCLVERTTPLPLKFALQNPDLYAIQMTYKILNQVGIKLQGTIQIGHPPHSIQQEVASHESKPLTKLIDVMLKKSDNLIANNITKMLGHQFFLQPGSFANGTEAIKQILYTKADINLQSAQLVDGSGLSRNNRITADQMASVLRYIWQHDQTLHLVASLPVAGQSGTLKDRRSMQVPPIKGHLSAKSGSIYGSYNMAGYGLDKHGHPKVLFVQFISDYFPEHIETSERQKRHPPLEQFEKQFYTDIIRNSQK